MGTGLGLEVLLSSLGSSVLYLQQAPADSVSLKVGILVDCHALHLQFFMASVSCWLSEHQGNGWEYLLCFKKIEKLLLFLQQCVKKCVKGNLILFIMLKRNK